MNNKIKQLLENSKGKTVGIFIDNANWFYPQKELGWQVSFSKLISCESIDTTLTNPFYPLHNPLLNYLQMKLPMEE